ncbi:hypothetical protein [Leuconostoc rapi]|uniref:hypothetical protein n=1 Tax=Leuconostoc rapi TaxID=1406906 RepID=UPI00195938B1|nr:hypothetical protein [Leuconostoc rapi]MBM7435912.1 high-affinity Fe2+/Pb2+ permease [Leuconostoc rapi]
MQLPIFRQALEKVLPVQIVDDVLMKAYTFQDAKNQVRKARAQYGTVKLEREADAMWEQIIANILVSMQGYPDADILKQLADADFIESLNEMLEEVTFDEQQ